MCIFTCPVHDSIDLAGIHLRDKYTHLCFLSAMLKGMRNTPTFSAVFFVIRISSYNFLSVLCAVD